MTQADLLPTNAKTAASRAAVSGARRKRLGQDLALKKEKAEWVERFIWLSKCYLTSLEPGALFAIEDLRAYAEACELPAPHVPNVFGAMPRVLIKAGLPIRRTDKYRKASSPSTHAHPVALYEKTAGGRA